MGILIKTMPAFLYVMIVTVLFQCSSPNDIATSDASVGVSIATATSVTQIPEELVISIANENGFYQERIIQSVSPTGKTSFSGVPYGHLFVDVTGNSKGIRTLYGHNEIKVETPRAAADVFLRNVLEIKILTQLQEIFYLENLNVRSNFWDDLPRESSANCVNANNDVILRTIIASSPEYIYFLFEVHDPLSFADVLQPTNFGEMTADAIIVYLSPIPPHAMTPDNFPFEAARFQFETGRATLSNCQFNLTNFVTDFVRDNILGALTDNDITAKIVSHINPRIFEIRIRKGLLLSNPQNMGQFGIIIRYRDGDNNQVYKWQEGDSNIDPRNNASSWGYLEFNKP